MVNRTLRLAPRPCSLHHSDMGEIVKFQRPSTASKATGNTLCRNGMHKWEVVKDSRFDVDKGRLLTEYRCRRCGRTKTAAH